MKSQPFAPAVAAFPSVRIVTPVPRTVSHISLVVAGALAKIWVLDVTAGKASLSRVVYTIPLEEVVSGLVNEAWSWAMTTGRLPLLAVWPRGGKGW